MDGHRGFLAKEIVKNCKERFNFFTNKIVAPWNTPPDYILQSDSVNIFKARLDKHLKTDLTDQAATVGLIPKTCFTGVSPFAAYLTTTTMFKETLSNTL